MACYMARGERVGLAIPVLSTIYRGLNAISKSNSPGDARVGLPFHYIHGWLAAYFNTHYPTPTELKGPLMAKFSGEGGARYYDSSDAYRRIQNGNISWSITQLEQSEEFCFIDEGNNSASDTSYFLSIRSSFLPCRRGSTFGLEPYNPHRFARQFGFCQDVPDDITSNGQRQVSLEEGLKHWRACTITGTTQRAIFPLHEARFDVTKNYERWLKGPYAKHSRRAPPSILCRTDCRVKNGGARNNSPDRAQFRKPAHGKGKELHLELSRIRKPDSTTTPPAGSLASGKRKSSPFEEESDNNEDRNFKHARGNKRVTPDTPPLTGAFLDPIAELWEGVISPEGDDVGVLDSLSLHDVIDPQMGAGSSTAVTERHAKLPTRVPTSQVPSGPPAFEGEKFFAELAREYTALAWKRLCDQLMDTPVEHIVSIQGEVEIAVKRMQAISNTAACSLEETLKRFFRSARLFNEAQLQSSAKLTEEAHSGLISAATARHADVQSQIEQKGKLLEALEKKQEDIRLEIQQEKGALNSLQSDISKLEGDLALLKDSVPVSKEEATRLCQMKQDLEAQQQELGEFKLSF